MTNYLAMVARDLDALAERCRKESWASGEVSRLAGLVRTAIKAQSHSVTDEEMARFARTFCDVPTVYHAPLTFEQMERIKLALEDFASRRAGEKSCKARDGRPRMG